MYSSVTETEIDLMSKQGYCLRALARARMRRERVAFLATLAAALAVADAVVSSPPLIQALVDDDASRALELIAAGEDVSVLDIVTPLYAAQEYLRSHAQRRSVLRRLIESGAAVDQTTQDGTTTLMLAAYQGDARSAQLLLDAGADPTRRNDGGHSAVLAAEQGGHLELAEQLREHADERWVALAGLVERHVSEVHGGLRRLLSAACPAAEPARLPSPAEQRRGEVPARWARWRASGEADEADADDADGVGVGGWARRAMRGLYRSAPSWAVCLGLLWLSSRDAPPPAGHRLLLAAYPSLYTLLGALGTSRDYISEIISPRSRPTRCSARWVRNHHM